MKARHKRFGIVIVGLAALGLATYLVLNALEGNLSYFFSPTEVAEGKAPGESRLPPRRPGRGRQCARARRVT